MPSKNEKKKVARKAEERSFLKKHVYEAIICLFSFLLFANSIPNDYNLDDELVTNNHRLTSKGISAIPEIFTSSYYKDNMGYAYEYRPVVLTSFAIEHQLFGDNPHVSHFFNVLLYALCCIILFRVLTNLSDLFLPAFSFVIVLIFAVHPSHTEVVSSIKNRDEILGLIFCFLTFWIAIKAVRKTSWLWLLALPITFALALMNKITFLPFAVIIPLGLILFSRINSAMIFVTSVALAIPSFYLINTGNFADKVFICFGLVTIPLLLTLIVRFQSVAELLQTAIQYISKPKGQPEVSTADGADYENFHSFFKNLSPSPYFSLYPLIGTATLALIFFTGVILDFIFFEILAFLTLLFLVLKGNEKWSWWSNVAIYTCLVLTILKWQDPIFYGLVIIAVCYQLFFGNRNLRLPAAIAWLLIVALNAWLLQDTDPIFYTIILAGLRTKAKWLFGVVAMVLAGVVLFTGDGLIVSAEAYWYSQSTTGISAYLGLVFTSLVITVLLKKNGTYIIRGIWVVAVTFLVLNQVFTDNSPPIKIKNRIEVIGKDLNTNVINEKQDRPISFIEQPVSPTDPWQIRTGTAMRVLFHYFIKTIVPYPLAFYYGYKAIAPEEITRPIPLLSVLVHLFLLFCALYFFKKNRVVFFGIGIYLVSVVTFANYFAPVPGVVGDRYLLIPSLGWAIILTVLLLKIWGINVKTQDLNFSEIPKGFKYSLGFVLCFYSLITFSRNFQWKDSLTLFRHDIHYVEESAMAQNLVAIHSMRASEKEINPAKQTELKQEALVHFKRALEIYPKFFNVAFDIGRVYLSLNMQDSAIEAFKHAAFIGSDYIMVYKNLTDLLFSKGRYEEAIPYLKFIIERKPTEFQAYDRLSFVYFKRRDYKNSIAVNKNAMQQFPYQIDPVFNIGRTYLEMNQTDSARYYLLKANQLSPGNALVQQLLKQINR